MLNLKKFLQGAGLGIIILSLIMIARGRILKNAQAVLHNGMYGWGIRVVPINEEAPSAANNWTYAVTFRFTNEDNPDGWWKFEFLKCICPEGAGETGGNCLRCERSEETISLRHAESVNRTISGQQPNGGHCGSFQFDINIIGGSVHGCVEFQGGHYGPVWGLWKTNIDCGPHVTPTPTTPITPTPTPTCPLTPTPTTPVITSTPTPTPPEVTPTPPELTPTPPSKRGCWQVCGHDSECDGGLSCQQIDDTKRCVKSECNREQDCNCAAPTPPQVLGGEAPKVLPAAGIKEDLSEILFMRMGFFGALLSLIAIIL